MIDRPATRRTGVTQATRGWPSTSTVQHPHWPCGLHPSLAERSPRSSRSTSSSDAPRSATSTCRPSTSSCSDGRSPGGIASTIGSPGWRALPPDSPGDASSPLAGAGAGAVALGACGGGRRRRRRHRRLRRHVRRPRARARAVPAGARLLHGHRAAGSPSGWPTADGLLTLEDTPEELEVTVIDPDGGRREAARPSSATATGCPAPYFPLARHPRRARASTRSAPSSSAEPPSRWSSRCRTPPPASMVKPGDQMPGSLDTPTTADARGVDPICTADPVCPLHDVTLADALAAGDPIALLVATPGVLPDRRLRAGARRAARPRRPTHPDVQLPARRGVRSTRHVNPDGDYAAVLTDLRPGSPSRRCSSSAPTASWPSASTRSTTGGELNAGRSTRPQLASAAQVKDLPQPQVRWALGLSMANPAPWRPSL